MTRAKRLYILLAFLALVIILLPFKAQIRALLRPLFGRGRQKTVAEQVKTYGPAARARLAPYFNAAGVSYPPTTLVMVGIKDEDALEIYAAPKDGAPRYIHRYPILAASGELGPKLREGDVQVPEGIYHIDWLNPNSLYHLSLHVTYPNNFDSTMAKRDGRNNLGGDIMIHGGNASVGCLAMGDQAAEELFVLAADTGLNNITLILTPTDFRKPNAVARVPNPPAWIAELYAAIKAELKRAPLPTRTPNNSAGQSE